MDSGSTTAIARGITKCHFINLPIRITVENGNITSTGVVNCRVEKAKLESIARRTLIVRVDNKVQVESEIEKEPAGRASTKS